MIACCSWLRRTFKGLCEFLLQQLAFLAGHELPLLFDNSELTVQRMQENHCSMFGIESGALNLLFLWPWPLWNRILLSAPLLKASCILAVPVVIFLRDVQWPKFNESGQWRVEIESPSMFQV
jgi:hypothetical protein